MKKEIKEQVETIIKLHKEINKMTSNNSWNAIINMNFEEVQKLGESENKLNKEEGKLINLISCIDTTKKIKDISNFVKAIDRYYDNESVLEEIYKFDVINKSPYSNSYYNSNNIGWDSKPEGSLRLSDHWNFESNGEVHCKLDSTEEYIQKTLLCEYHNGYYHVIKNFD